MTDPSRPRIPASVLAITAMFSVQFGNAFVGSLFDQLDPLAAAALRLAFAAVILAIVVRPRMRGWSRRTWLGVLLLGVGLGGMNATIYLAIDEIPIGIAVTIELLGPLALAMLGTRRWIDGAWVLLALGGVLLLGLDTSGTVTLRGALFACIAAVFWALYIWASANLGGRVRGIDGLVASMMVAAIVVVPFGAVGAVQAVRASPSLLLAFAVVAILTSVVPYALEFQALKRMPTRVFGVLSSLGPAIAALAGLVVLHQRLAPTQLLAIVLVIAASAGVVATARRSAGVRP